MSDIRPGKPKQENPIISILVNIVVPVYIWDQFSGPDKLGPMVALFVGLAFPLSYGAWDFLRNGRKNWISALGIVRLVVVGSFAIAEADGIWFAAAEAAFPALIAVFIAMSMRSDNPMVKMFLYNDTILDISKIENRLQVHGKTFEFQRLMRQVSWLLVFSFALSAVLNFVLARVILKSPAGTEAFSKEFARMTLLSWPVIVVPSLIFMGLALWRLFQGIRKLTGLGFDDIFVGQPAKQSAEGSR